MQRMFRDSHICRAVLRGKLNHQIFETEIQKKKVLDAAMQCREQGQIQILAYCVLDNEFHLVLEGETAVQTADFMESLKEEFLKRTTKERCVFRKIRLYKITGKHALIRWCIKLHTYPVVSGRTRKVEDYWWCSYPDYFGRKWMPLTSVFSLLSLMEVGSKRAREQFHILHQQEMKKVFQLQNE